MGREKEEKRRRARSFLKTFRNMSGIPELLASCQTAFAVTTGAETPAAHTELPGKEESCGFKADVF